MTINHIIFAVYTVTSVCALLLIKVNLSPALQSLKVTPDIQHLTLAAFGAVLYVASFLMWMFVLTKFDLTVAYPIAVGLTLAFTAVAGVLVLGEHLSAVKLLGMALIASGVIAIVRG